MLCYEYRFTGIFPLERPSSLPQNGIHTSQEITTNLRFLLRDLSYSGSYHPFFNLIPMELMEVLPIDTLRVNQTTTMGVAIGHPKSHMLSLPTGLQSSVCPVDYVCCKRLVKMPTSRCLYSTISAHGAGTPIMKFWRLFAMLEKS